MQRLAKAGLSNHHREQTLSVSNRLRQSRKRIVSIFFILEAEQMLILNLHRCAQNCLQVKDATPGFDCFSLRVQAGYILEVHVVQTRAALDYRFCGIDFCASRVTNINAESDTRV